MIDKLRSHLRSEKGFTLIELLVVIAIIAILVTIVIVAINPVQRLADATDRTAASNVRATGTLIATCVTSNPTAPYTSCDTNALVVANGKGNVPVSVTVSGVNDVCADEAGNTGAGGTTAHWYRYQQSTGTVATLIAAPAPCP